MYTLVRAYGVKRSLNSLWAAQDITTLKAYELFQLFRELYVELSNDFIADPIYVKISDHEDDLLNVDKTFVEYLALNPDKVFTTVPSIPEYEVKPSKYMDAVMAGYKIETTAPGHAPNSIASKFLKTELTVKREGVLPRDLHDYTLITVNGFLHQTDYDVNYCYVLDGGHSLLKSNRANVGINSFERIGKVHKHQIVISDVSKVNPDTLLSEQVLVKIPEEFAGMQIMFSIGGYLVLPEENVTARIADDLWVINLTSLDIPGRYFESRNYLNYDSLNLTTYPKDEEKINLEELLSDPVMLSYLTLKQSFIIAVEADNLSTKKHFVRHSTIAGQYITYSNPTAPLFLGRGRQADYWKTQDESQFLISVDNGFRPNLVNDTVDLKSHPSDSGANPPYNLFINSRAFLLEFLCDVKKK